ncbi:response regulator transcription factor [Amycolatopsis sp. H20-H5]|uniref:response regulator transcription factor n=1 Tax=Amycolatopsis sp. H20-H5 TaxID=3046309 RepID=UPI002DC01611|nr:response regulator transcription factor [Amycolatopsis sp. H20-H5]MEC3978263.1 response regulator transcription factor [Amycolatopsis sp. H20-H5]
MGLDSFLSGTPVHPVFAGPWGGRAMRDDPGVITIVVIDNQQLSRQGMTEVLSAEPDLEVVGGSGFGREATLLAGRVKPDVILLDGEFGGAHATTSMRGLLAASPASKLVTVIAHDDPRLVGSLIVAGAHAYVLRSATRDELLVTLRAAHRDSGHVLVSVSRATLEGINGANQRLLSRREREVMLLVAVGMKNSEIAHELFISEGTVKRHLTNTYTKLGVVSRMGAVKKAVSLGIVLFGEAEQSGAEDQRGRSTGGG